MFRNNNKFEDTMGCSNSRTAIDNQDMKTLIMNYIEDTKIDQITCNFIRRLDVQFREETIDKESYAILAKNWNIKADFELFSRGNVIEKLDLKLGLLALSIDSDENRVALLKELVSEDARICMKFAE